MEVKQARSLTLEGTPGRLGAALRWKQLLSEPIVVMVPVCFGDSVVRFNLESRENSAVGSCLWVVLSVRGEGNG